MRDFEFIHTTRFNTIFVKEVPTQRIDNGRGSPMQAKLLSEFGLLLDEIRLPMFDDRDLLGEFIGEYACFGKFKKAGEREKETAALAARNRVKEEWKRFAFAMAGGLALMVPMLVLTVHKVPDRSLVTITIAIFLFSGGVAVFSQAAPENLLGATAAYAAVLMAFVGGAAS
jgi:hypothetical protein